MREIDRTRYLRGTRAWTLRNWFIFGGLATTVLMGVASILMFPEKNDRLLKKIEVEKAAKASRREKIEAIKKHRMQIEQEGNLDEKE